MRSRHIVVGVAISGAATAGLALGTPATAVSPNFSLTTGGSSAAGTVSYTANIPSSTSVVLTDLTSGAQFFCTAASASGTVNRGLNRTGPTIGTITGTQFGTATPPSAPGGTPLYGSNPCVGVGANIPLAVRQTGTWKIVSTDFSSPNSVPAPVSGQTTTGAITNIRATVYIRNTCTFDIVGVNGAITGTAAGSFSNTATGTLEVASAGTAAMATLQVANVRVFNGAPNCLAGSFKNGDKLSFTGSYNVTPVSPATGPLWVRT